MVYITTVLEQKLDLRLTMTSSLSQMKSGTEVQAETGKKEWES
jgi:hypothetical protein